LLVTIACLPVLLFAQNKPAYNEPYRPQYHYSPHHNWTNDPNGLVYFKGQYHLFYQYNPMGNTWGHMSWAHTVSTDLVHWQPMPLAIPEDEKNMIFSGSCVVDKNNTSGFAVKPGQIPMVAVYTAHIIPDKSKPDDYQQNQHIAYSLDDGRTWKKYEGNPVLDQHKKDFRDPKVFWYAPGKKWIMAVVLPHDHIVQFYGSPDLKTWSHLSDFGPAGDVGGIWECPDLLQVPVSGQPGKSKWVLINSQQTTMQYFVGEFDGTAFHNENPANVILRPDYGPDFYAGITYNNLPAGTDPILLGWANNWTYGQSIPTSPWRSAMSLPRSLQVKKAGNTWLLLEQPVKSLQSLRNQTATAEWENKTISSEVTMPVKGQVLEMIIDLVPAPTATCGVKLAASGDQAFVISYDAAQEKLLIDRSQSGNTSFNNEFTRWKEAAAHVPLQDGKLRLHIFLDKSLVEVFANDGSTVITAQHFPYPNHNDVVVFSQNGTTKVPMARIWQLKSAWK
jgi:fructan beta-fructosidase